MPRKHALPIVLLLSAAAVAGLVALGRTVALGASTAKPAPARIAAREHTLDRYEASLKRELARRPPKLPAVPAPAGASGTHGQAAGTPPRVLYVRPKPIVVTTHSSSGYEGEHERDDGQNGGRDD